MFKKKVKSQVIKFEQNGYCVSAEDVSVLFLKLSDIVATSEALVEVPYTHNAFIIKGGGDCRFYKSGTYPVFDNKHEIEQWKKGVSVDIVYMPKETNEIVRWGTRPFEYRDKISEEVIHTGVRGSCHVTITNHEQFYRKVVGTKSLFTTNDFENFFRALFSAEVGNCFLEVIKKLNLSYDLYDANLMRISTELSKILVDKFYESYGISITNFIVEGTKTSDEDKAKVEEPAKKLRKEQEELKKEQEELKKEAKFKEYLAELERLDDKQWEREKYLRQLEQEDNMAYYEVLKAIGKKDVSEKAKGANFCSKCGHSCETTAEFCPNCGNRLGKSSVICPQCSKVNVDSASFCSGCGKKLK